MKIKPLKNRILLQYIDNPKTTREGIIIPDTASKTDQFGFVDRGKIMAIGKDVNVKELEIKVGDTVVFKKAEAIHVNVSGSDTEDGRLEKYLLVPDNAVKCKIQEKTKKIPIKGTIISDEKLGNKVQWK